MSAILHEEYLAVAIEAVSHACSVTRRVQARLTDRSQLTKDDRSPVTVADFAAQAVVAQTLSRRSPIKLIGEESSAVLRDGKFADLRNAVVDAVQIVWPGASTDAVLDAIDLGNHDASGAGYWTLDPVDGTKGFIRGQQYAVSLAWIEAGSVMLGVLGCPNLSADFNADFNVPDRSGTIFFAVRDHGCWSIPADQPAAAAQRVAARVTASGGIQTCESVEAEHSSKDDAARILEFIGGAGIPARLDSQCKYGVVARGQADAYLRLPTRKGYVEKIWDHAAGDIIAREAGALVTDITGKALDYSHGATLDANRGVVCASVVYHARLLDAISRLGISA